MGTNVNLHKITFTMLARNRRVKSLLDFRKSRRSQVFLGHRFRHFIVSDDQIRVRYQAIWWHLHSIIGYTMEQKFTTLLLVMIKETPQIADFIRIDLQLLKHINNEFNEIVTSICYILNEIGINYLVENQQYIQCEYNAIVFRPSDNSISYLMSDILARLLNTFGNRCKIEKLPLTKHILSIFELCYLRYSHFGNYVIRQNLYTLLGLTEGIGRFQRTQIIAEYEPLMFRLFGHQHMNNSDESLIVLQIANNICNGFPENIRFLLKSQLLDYLKHHLSDANTPRYEILTECTSILGNICGNHRSDIQNVIDADLFLPLVNVFISASNSRDQNLLKLLLNTFCNITTLGSIEQIKALLDRDILRLLCCQLNCQVNLHEDILEITLEVLTNILTDFYRKDHQTFHKISSIIMMNGCDGFVLIKNLKNYGNESIARMACELSAYGNETCEKCNQMNGTATFETMQQRTIK